MKLKAEQLARTLKNERLPLYWLAGDEPLLMQEAADAIRQTYRDQGYIEREVFHVDRSFNWEEFSQSTGNLSLFTAQKIIELRLSGAKLDDAGKAAVHQYLDDPNPDFLVLISGPRLDASTLNTKWFKQIEARSALVQIWPVNRDNLGPWLERRLVQEGIRPDAEALGLLMDKVEGNLLAAMQEIEKLKLLANSTDGKAIQLDAKTVMQVVADSSRFNVYHMVDAALAGEAARAQRMLVGLQAEGIFPLVILGAISRELRSLLPMIEKREQGQPVAGIIQSAHVWFNRKQPVGAAIKRLGQQDIWDMLSHARRIDESIKGMSSDNSWDEMSLLLLRLSGVTTATMNRQAL